MSVALATRSNLSRTEWDLRVQLAAAYRIAAELGWSELIYTHISARIPGRDHHFLINPYGLRFDEVTASRDRKSTRLNSSHMSISYAVFCLKKKKKNKNKIEV